MSTSMAAEKNPPGARAPGQQGQQGAYGQAPRVWTEEEVAEKLGGYLEVPPEYWDQIRYGTHIRYFTHAEGFRPGGFVMKAAFDARPKGGEAEVRFLKLQNGFNDKARGYASWVVKYGDLSKVFVKPDATVLVMMSSLESSVKGLNENIRKLAEFSKKLEARISALEPHTPRTPRK